MTDYEEQLPDDEKVRIVSNFICNAPPGEFKEVLTDVRSLLNNDTLLKEQASGVFSQYSKDQLTPVNIEGSECPTLITKFNDLGGGRFVDPRTQQSFKYDPLREEASQLQEHSVNLELEGWRSPLEATWTIYCKEHYCDGANAVFADLTENGHITLNACIEDHQFQPKNFWNGRWRSVWSITFNPNTLGEKCPLEGAVKVQVHYYEDGNVQLVSSKDIAESVVVNNETQLANDFVKTVENAENEYQNAISENYQTMSDVTFKALRRPLPLTRSKIEWSNMKGYRIGSELKQQ